MAALRWRQADEERAAGNGEEGPAGHEEEGAAGDAQVAAAGAVNIIRTCEMLHCAEAGFVHFIPRLGWNPGF